MGTRACEDSKKDPPGTPAFSITAAGQIYYYCTPCSRYYNEESFYKICIQRKYRRCKICYEAFKKTDGMHDSVNRPDSYYVNQLNRTRATFKAYWSSAGTASKSDILDALVVKCVMTAWGHRSILSGETDNLSLCRWNPAIEVGLRPDNLMIFTKEQVRRMAHRRLWTQALEDEELSKRIQEDARDFRLRLCVLLEEIGRRDIAQVVIGHHQNER